MKVAAVVGGGAADPVAAVKSVASSEPGICPHAGSYLVPPCPVTQRLAARLDAHPFSGPGGGAVAVCRCQNAGTLSFALLSQTGATAYVHEDLGFGGTGLRWTAIKVNDHWYVDDQDQGCAATSIYNPAYDAVAANATPGPAPPAC